MGNRQSEFTKDQLLEYERCTFFTRKEILKIHKIFKSFLKWEKSLSKHEFIELPMLKYNPFRERIHKVFCSDQTDGKVNFDDFLDFLSCFSPDASATPQVKAYAAFKIYDMDDDGVIGSSDLTAVVKTLVEDELLPSEIETIVSKIIEEVDIDGDGDFSYVEFEQIVQRAPDFVNLFRIQIL